MKRPNGAGGIRKLSGKRSKPYQAVVSYGLKWNGSRFVQDQRSLGVFRTRTEALDALASYRLNPVNLEGRDLTFDDVYELIRDDFTDSMKVSLRASFKQLQPVLGGRKVVDIKKRELDMVAQVLADKSSSTQRNAKILISRVFKYSMENDYITKDYSQFLTFREKKERAEKRAFRPEEIRELLQADPFTRVMLYTGMRPGELADMKSSQIYEENGILCFHIDKAKTKAGIRVVPVHSEIEDVLELGNTFPITPHRSYSSRRTSFLRYMDESGLYDPGHTLHDLRRTFATYAKHCGMDEFCRKAIMGHAQQGVTDAVYTDSLVPDLKKNIELLRYE